MYVGPNDLALSLGERPGLLQPPPRSPTPWPRIAEVTNVARRWAGVFCADAPMARRMIGLGYHLVTPGNDVTMLRAEATRRIETVRSAGR